MQTHAGYTKPCWTWRDWRAGAYAVTADRTNICQRRPPRVLATSHEQV